MKKRLFQSLLWSSLLLLVIFAVNSVRAEGSMWEASAKNPVPPDARVMVESDQQEYYLGENVLLHFILNNSGGQPFEADFGGDYRGATRHLRFKVTATDETGRVADDPDTSGFCGGGLGGGRTLKPGENFIQSLPLMRYCRILQPGRYTIRVTHDYGWKEGERKRPAAEIKLTFRMPTEVEAEAVIAEMAKLPSDPNNSYEQRTRNYSDFSMLRQPVYIKPLLNRAKGGNRDALEGLCWIASPEATRSIIELATNADPKLAVEAAKALTLRLPGPSLESTNGFGGFPPFTREARRWLVKGSWDSTATEPVRSLALSYLNKSETEEIASGAFIIQAVGTADDGPAVRSALDRVLDPMVRPRRDPKDNILDQPEPVRQLLGAMNALHSRGYAIGEDDISRQAAFLLYFTWLANEPTPRPGRWLDILNVFGENCRYPTRVAALNSIPEPVPDDCIPFVRSRLTDQDLGVCRTACAVAGRSGKEEFIEPLIEIISTEQHEWLLREASDAARKLGAGFDLLDAWSGRLTDEHLFGLALDSLQTVIEGLPGSSSGRTDLTRAERIELRNQWRDFLAKHADEIRDGKKFKVDDPALSPALFGRARTWRLANGNPWPITQAEIDKAPQK